MNRRYGFAVGGLIKDSTPVYRKRWKRWTRAFLIRFQNFLYLTNNVAGSLLRKIKPDGLDIHEFQPTEWTVVPKGHK